MAGVGAFLASDDAAYITGQTIFIDGGLTLYASTSGSPPMISPTRKTASRSAAKGDIHLAKTYHNTEPHSRLLARLKDLLGPLGCHQTSIPRWSVFSQQIPIAGIAHQCGTVRFGTDPGQSALDVNCKAHDVDNLYVGDTSFFPSSSAVNPALTAMANALRVGDHLLERLGAPSAGSAATNVKFERSDTTSSRTPPTHRSRHHEDHGQDVRTSRRRPRGVVGQGAQRAAAEGGRGANSAALRRPKAGGGSRPSGCARSR